MKMDKLTIPIDSPIIYSFEITNKCMLKYKHCYNEVVIT